MEELNQARQAHSTLEGDLAGALALQQQEAQSIAKERDAAMARALAAEKQASDLKVAKDKLFQQQQVCSLPQSCDEYASCNAALPAPCP